MAGRAKAIQAVVTQYASVLEYFGELAKPGEIDEDFNILLDTTKSNRRMIECLSCRIYEFPNAISCMVESSNRRMIEWSSHML